MKKKKKKKLKEMYAEVETEKTQFREGRRQKGQERRGEESDGKSI